MKKRMLLTTAFVVGVLMVGVLSTSVIYAQDANYPTIIERLASRFNLNKDEVKKVFEEVRDEHRADVFANWADRLDDLVSEGKITAEQKQAILDKHEEMQAKMEELKDLEPGQRREKMKAYHEEMKKWAADNNLEFPFMAFKFGFRKGLGAGYFNEKLD